MFRLQRRFKGEALKNGIPNGLFVGTEDNKMFNCIFIYMAQLALRGFGFMNVVQLGHCG
jgi:hypothetical protein